MIGDSSKQGCTPPQGIVALALPRWGDRPKLAPPAAPTSLLGRPIFHSDSSDRDLVPGAVDLMPAY